MREIKCRGLVIEPLVSGNKWITSDDEYHEIYINRAEKTAYINGHEVEYESVSQYTGLKDKNGKEIYEGDIVLLHNEFADWIGSVIFDEGAFKLSINHSWGNSIRHFSKTDVFEDMGARTTLNNTYEIIGNIYENPELLGDSN